MAGLLRSLWCFSNNNAGSQPSNSGQRDASAPAKVVNGGGLPSVAVAPLPAPAHRRPSSSSPSHFSEETTDAGQSLLQRLRALNFRNIRTLADVTLSGISGEPVNDQTYLMERIIQLAADLPYQSVESETVTKLFLKQLWDDLQHPPQTSLGAKFAFREADGSNNSLLFPNIGAAGQPYARTVRPKKEQPVALPDPGVIFDSVLARRKFESHPNSISSVLFYLATIIIHDIFHTSHQDFRISETSSYLDLAPLYGSSREDQLLVRTRKDGKLKADCFSDKRVLGFPPGVGVLLIFFNRFHNHAVETLAKIDENGRFSSIRHPRGRPGGPEAEEQYDEVLFQTGRLVTTGLYINVILKDYVRTILNLNSVNSKWNLDPRSEEEKSLIKGKIPEGLGNQVSAEFNAIYRWHSTISQRDEAWTDAEFRRLLGGKDPATLTISEVLAALQKWSAALPADPQQRPFHGLKRQPDGTLPDGELASIWIDSVNDLAGAFGALNVPDVMRSVEMLGIIQARSWNLASLNEFREYFNLTAHKTFEDINPDPYVQEQLRNLYGHPDNVELYPGVIIEETKKSMSPGSGLCTNFTISRAILSDAVALVRSDRFYTIDSTPKNLTNWGFKHVEDDISIDYACSLNKVVLTALPNHFATNSIYAHYPMVTPAKNQTLLKKLGQAQYYDFEVPKGARVVRTVSSQADIDITTGLWSRRLINVNGLPPASSQPLSAAFFGSLATQVQWRPALQSFFQRKIRETWQQAQYRIGNFDEIDLVKDVVNEAYIHLLLELAGFSDHDVNNLGKSFSSLDLQRLLGVLFDFGFTVAPHTTLNGAHRKQTRKLVELIAAKVAHGKHATRRGDDGEGRALSQYLSVEGKHAWAQVAQSDQDTTQLAWNHVLPEFALTLVSATRLSTQFIDKVLSGGASDIAAAQSAGAEAGRGKAAGAEALITQVTAESAQVTIVSDTADTAATSSAGQTVVYNVTGPYLSSNASLKIASELHEAFTAALLEVVAPLPGLDRVPGPLGQLKQIRGDGDGILYLDERQNDPSNLPTTLRSPAVAEFVDKLVHAPLAELPQLLASWGQRWAYPRGDLMHWVGPLDRFDSVLETVITTYGLDRGPQTTPFDRRVLLLDGSPGYKDEAALAALGFGPDGDRQLVEAILDFSRLLMEKCANRPLYNSTERLNALLNTTSLPLLHQTLRLTIFLAQRYTERVSPNSLPVKFYSYDHYRLRQLASPIATNVPPSKRGPPSPVKTTKDKDSKQTPRPRRTSLSSPLSPNDFRALCRERETPNQQASAKATSPSDREWAANVLVRVVWFSKPAEPAEPKPPVVVPAPSLVTSSAPATPSPLRQQISATQDAETTAQSDQKPAEASFWPKLIEYTPAELANTTIEKVLETIPADLPPEQQYELLHKLRVAYALMSSPQSRQDLLAVRILAINALANVFGSGDIYRELLSHDSGAIKPQELVKQLVSLIQEPRRGEQPIRRYMQTLSMETLGVLAHHKLFAGDIIAALGASSRSGLLLRLTRRGLKDIEQDGGDSDNLEGDDWREAVFSMPRVVLEASGHGRSGENIIAADFISAYSTGFELTTAKAMRIHLRMLDFVKTYFHHFKDGLVALLAATAFDQSIKLLRTLVDQAWELFSAGQGIEPYYKTKLTDYQIPHLHQQIIRSIIDMINDISRHHGPSADRVLRSLVDSQALPAAFKRIIANLAAFGAQTWSETVKAICAFLNSDPPSYNVFAEAGIIKSFLSTITNDEPPPAAAPDTPRHVSSVSRQEAPGIPASVDAILNVAAAFEAICLTTPGFDAFKGSGALEKFFQIFESPVHVKAMAETKSVRELGQTFDELVRHHPNLRSAVTSAIIVMLARVRHIGRVMAFELGAGPKLWVLDGPENAVSGGRAALQTEIIPPPRPDTPLLTLRPIKLPNRDILEFDDSIPVSTEHDPAKASISPDGLLIPPASPPEIDVIQHHAEDVNPDDQDSAGLNVSDYLRPAVGFLSTFLSKLTTCSTLLDCGAQDIILDFVTLPSIPASSYPFGLQGFLEELSGVIHMLAETKPYLILPVLTERAKYACQQLIPFSHSQPRDTTSYFAPLIFPQADAHPASSAVIDSGTHLVRSLTAVYCLATVLGEVFNAPVYSTRSAQTYLFGQVNLADHFAELALMLGSISSACNREAVVIQKTIKPSWAKATTPEHFSTGDDDVDRILGVWETGSALDNPPSASTDPSSPAAEAQQEAESLDKDRQSPAFKNLKTIRYLVLDTPTAINDLLTNLGHGIVGKRRPEAFARQKISLVADALAETYVNQLRPYFLYDGESLLEKDARYAYLVVSLSYVRNCFYDMNSTASVNACQSYIIQAFKNRGGVRLLAQIGFEFFDELKQSSPDQSTVYPSAGLKICLDTLDELTNAKSIVESPQASVLKCPDSSKSYYFVPHQLLLELRMEALPLTKAIWDSDYADLASPDLVQKLISILKHALTGDQEGDAIKTQSSHPPAASHTPRRFAIDGNKVRALQDKGYPEDLAHEAIYRTNPGPYSNYRAAEEYCEAMLANPRRQRQPAPAGETDIAGAPRDPPAGQRNLIPTSTDIFSTPDLDLNALLTHPLNNAAAETEVEDLDATPPLGVDPTGTARSSTQPSASSTMDLSHILNESEPNKSSTPKLEPPTTTKHSVETIEAKRASLRANLVDRCNNLLASHQTLAFELSDLISSAAKKLSPESSKVDFWEATARLLITSLISTQGEEMTESHGKRVAAAAHLIGLIISHDDEVFRYTWSIYQSSFEAFIAFLKLPQTMPKKTADQIFPWVPPILLIVEKLLARDCEPDEIRFDPPRDLDSFTPAHLTPTTVWDMGDKKELFNCLIRLLPRVGKDRAMALSIARVLVILTRHRELATLLAQRENLHYFFSMIKELPGVGQTKLLLPFMVILRHMLEDEETLKQIMRSEIKAAFTGRAGGRTLDLQSYTRELYYVALRDPKAFVDVTQEMLNDLPPATDGQGEPSQTQHEATTRVESTNESKPEGTKQKTTDLKLPVVEHPDGVIHFILSELQTTGQNAEDEKQGDSTKRSPTAEESAGTSEPENSLVSAANGIVAASDRINALTRQLSGLPDRSDEAFSEPDNDMRPATAVTDPDSAKFKPDEHPIFLYRCFLLSCLVEVLNSYTRTKVELINFSRKSDPLATTPSKPRSGILNYLLTGLVCSGYVDKDNKSLHCRKKIVTSDLACKVIVALCAKTGEKSTSGPTVRYSSSPIIEDNDDEPDLTFVRRFVLEHAIRAFKDATASAEPLQVKYSKLLCLSDMFNRLLSKPITTEGSTGSQSTSYKVIGRMMFDKNLVSVLTSSLAEIDLAHPSSKRVIKFILKPLHELTAIAHQLSLTSPELISSALGNSSDDNISYASSVSEVQDDREETPDLYRNSALGMLDPNLLGGRDEELDLGVEHDDDDLPPTQGTLNWGFEDPTPRPPRIFSRRHGAPRVIRGLPPGFLPRGVGGQDGVMGPSLSDLARVPGRRSGRSDVDDGSNPLLHRPSSHTVRPSIQPGDAIAFTRELGAGLPPELAGFMPTPMGNGVSTVIHTHGSGHQHGAILDAIMAAISRDEVAYYTRFHPAMTLIRWQQECRLIFGNSYMDKVARVAREIQSRLYPDLQRDEKERQRKQKEDDRLRLLKEVEIAKAEAEARQRQEAEERERAPASTEDRAGDSGPMEDIQPTTTSEETEEAAAGGEAGPSSSGAEAEQTRVFTTIRGRQLDITGLDIDREYLEALPEDLREEVIMQQYATRREEAQQQTGNADASGIDPDFLNALPEDIREEIRQQEAHAQRRREREEARRQQAQTAGQGQAGEMDNDDFFATLDPALRRAILAEQPAEILDQLAPRHAQEGREQARRLFHPFATLPTHPNDGSGRANRRDPKRQVVQLIDKAGVATLLRLMFLPQQGSLKANLWHILRNVCGNRQTRFEVINIILVILKEGSTDVSAVERSLASLSLRAKASSTLKTPQPFKRPLSMPPSSGLADEVTPLVVVQQCLAALKHLSQHGISIRTIFLREVDISAHSKFKKGKGKDAKVTKYPVNDLISLLDRKLIMESSPCLQSLAELLAAVTAPLNVLMRKEKEKPDEDNKDESKADEGTAAVDNAAATADGSRQEEAAAPAQPSPQTDAVMTDVSAVPPQQPGEEPAEGSGEGPDNNTASSDKQKEEKNEDEQSRKKFEPPHIPESNLELIVRIFVAQECTGETFHAALETMSSISTIPGTSAVFSRELIGHVKRLSDSIRSDIEEFLPVLREAQSSTDLSGPIASKFSQPGSDQVKLLQVLKALDFLAAPKKDGNGDESMAKSSILTASYEGLSLGPLWTKVSECLGIMSEKDSVISFATILLPLIESLMVVCKHTSLKDAPLARQNTQTQIPNSPGGVVEDDDSVESLFFNFTTEHRKILNDIIRQSPKLMQGAGSFSLLVKNPKVLDFDNKRAYFTKQIHSRLHQQRHVQPALQLNVRRDQVFQDSYKALYYKSADEMKYGKLNIRFNGEEGVDAGGVTREWFQVLARGIFNPNWALWEPVAADKTTFHPSKLSWVNGEHLYYFKFVGRIIGKALHEGRVLDCHFSRAVYKRMLGKQPSLKDLESMDLDYLKSLQWILENDITDSIMEDFSVTEEQFGESKIIDLIPNGRNVSVTEENKHEYVQKIVQYRLFDSVKEQMDEFVKGFHDIIPADLIAIFDEQELELLISGLPEIDVDDWKANTEYHNYNANSPQVTWFWRIVRAMSNEERAKLLQFITGTSKVPLNGFKDLEGMQGTTKFSIHRDPSQNRLPTSHTCFNQLDLPAYDNQETLKTNLMTAINLGADYFGFA
ncbi:hypothetical protein DV735_g3371, partial [Chaetothyriales sp. CBS 134920]